MRWQILVGLISRRGNCSIMAPACTDEHATYLLLYTDSSSETPTAQNADAKTLSALHAHHLYSLQLYLWVQNSSAFSAPFFLDWLMMLQMAYIVTVQYRNWKVYFWLKALFFNQLN